ncbi:MAG: HAD-IA family hydrolase [Propionibacteriaceae bacterium]|nr:HAD-IA family hydrolase [Propionibacteriaceae bacterium]
MERTAVIFDLGGVVLNWVPERAFEQVMDAGEVPPLLERIGFHDWNKANDAKDALADAEAELVALHPDDADAIRAYRTHFLHSVVGMVPGTAAVIAELQQAGVAVSALTNWSGELFAVARPWFGVLDRFADIVVSGHESIAKPDHRIFALACERGGLDPARTVFVDDSPANVVAADDFGLRGLRFHSADQLRTDLVELGLLGPRAEVTEPVFHWAVRTTWEDASASGAYPWSGRGIGYDEAGFVHGSFAHQLDATRGRFYADLADDEVVLLRLDPAPDLPLVVEDGFPHLFAPLPLDRVTVTRPPQ